MRVLWVVSRVQRSFRDSGSFPKFRRGNGSAYLEWAVLFLYYVAAVSKYDQRFFLQKYVE